jgi:uncharacterized membrane protein YjgN (DUF898 family)
MAGDERTQPPQGHQAAVQRRRGDPRDAQAASAWPQRSSRLRGEDDTTEPPPGVPRRPPGPPGEPIEAYSAGAPRERIVEDGRFGDLFVLFIINMLLGVLTLGLYRFWGKTRIRKYIWSRMSLRGDRFEYSGRGMELFLGFVFALLVFGPPFLGFFAWIYFDPPPQMPEPGETGALSPDQEAHLTLVIIAGIGLSVVGSYFIHVATYAAYRYRLSRTAWRGIRGSVGGSAWLYGLLAFAMGWLNALSMYWTKPWADTLLMKYRLSRTTVGSEVIVSKIDSTKLYGRFAVAWGLTAVATVVVVAVIVGLAAGFEALGRRPTAEELAGLVLAAVLLFLLIPFVWLITINFYRAALIREIAASSTLDGLAFRFDVGGWTLLWFNASNFLIVLLSFGLLLPLVILRYARFIARHLCVAGEIDYASLRQSRDRGPRYGEGIAEFFGVGVV